MYLALSTKEGVRWSCPSKILKCAFFEFGAILFATGQILPLTLARLPIGKGRNMKDVCQGSRLFPPCGITLIGPFWCRGVWVFGFEFLSIRFSFHDEMVCMMTETV